MYRGFKLNEISDKIKSYKGAGEGILNESRGEMERDLKKLSNLNGALSSEKASNSWFPSIKADIFLSHSHADEDDAMALVGWLHKEFGLTAFVDSAVWGYAGDLLEIIDDKYSRDSNGKYNYGKVSKSNGHVNMMLSSALLLMMRKCECLIFYGTENAYRPMNYMRNEGVTGSPWIYFETLMSRHIERDAPQRFGKVDIIASVPSVEALNESCEVDYKVNLRHLMSLNEDDLVAWESAWKGNKSRDKNALDYLYQLKK